MSWLFGSAIGGPSGTARTEAEIAVLATRSPEFTVHVVEVCRTLPVCRRAQQSAAEQRNSRQKGDERDGVDAATELAATRPCVRVVETVLARDRRAQRNG